MGKVTIEVNGRTGILELTESSVRIKRKGALGLRDPKNDKEIPLSQITAVHFEDARLLVAGFIQFSLRGGPQGKVQTVFRAAQDENCVAFGFTQQGAARAFKDEVQRRVTGAAEPTRLVEIEIGGTITDSRVVELFAQTKNKEESLAATAIGFAKGDYLLLTNQRVIFINKPTALLTERIKTRDIILETITAVEINEGRLWGTMTIRVPGERDRTTGAIFHGTGGVLSGPSENTFSFDKAHVREVFSLAAMIREMAANTKRGASQSQSSGIPEEIEKLARLHQQGILSAEEFETKKRELLARM